MATSVVAPVIVIAPDSFKGSLSAQQVAAAIGEGILRALPDAVVRLCPIADGGEGTLDALMHAGGEVLRLPVRGAGGAPILAAAGVLSDGSAVIESAEIVSLTDPVGTAVSVENRSTFGIGDALLSLMDKGQRRFLIGLGGSSTNDAGMGMLHALGIRLYDSQEHELAPIPSELARLARIDASGLDKRIPELELVAMSDVNNPLCGPTGATAVFGPQKGVLPEQVKPLDASLAHFASLLQTAMGRQAADLPGAGAAGGIGFGLLMLGAHFESGAETVANHIGLDAALSGADWLITGEGRSDAQTLHGKAPFIASRRARQAGVAATLLSGGIEPQALPELNRHFSGCFSIVFGPISLQDAIANAEQLLRDRAEQLAQLWKIASAAQAIKQAIKTTSCI
ncbi:glycerate kinase [Herbaspirillum sp. RTI4]|uniref:glycerate kinase n=1 Tax=Herbaspirillum sp. RTI4 TaxID=3048640 RepID=UPI003A102F02